MKYLWSALHNAFFPELLLEDYKSAEWDLSDLIEVSDDVFAEFSASKVGKVRVVGSDKMPAWADLPPPTHDQLVAAAMAEKLNRISQANDYMSSKQWPGKAAIGRLKGDELTQYNLWLDYLDALEAVDTSTVPNINWPAKPE
ncbi:tail fiber assembly protein [Citrobacter portucalensis]|uniref:Tail fiber assembly protein n=1 Tax=Citrobacter portucalensis TaxID=1639133 RepID=A0AAW7LWC4_9ENTR|nr:tail fiber assembly protein [Citrobacter portucalensis]EIJ3704028.1 tail fiber assembly protein [Escherichia coli]MDN4369412.1 tail fiber assembly protein [Citrobacter portucalensis]MDO1963388.1 tail fiber assembly protein [Escherichia coli]MDO1995999.1 tail fiber assembly protein [Escherichia coli]HEF2141085.1 tail fiber assembly protein [Escherichia coli]